MTFNPAMGADRYKVPLMMRLRHTGLLVFVFMVLSVASTVFAEQGSNAAMGAAAVTGVVTDESGATIPGVTVAVTRAGEQPGDNLAVTELDGRFKVSGIRPGSYHIDAVLEGFQPIATDVKLVTGQTIDLALKLVPAFGETLEVMGQAVPTGEIAVLESRRQSAVVSDSISSEEIRKTPDSSAAGVVERLTGVTLLGDKYVFVRGLGERYSGTTLNGSTVPTTETEKRVVPLDLFPAKLLDSVNVVKTYTPDKPGDFGSGVVEMVTTQFPPSQSLKFTIGTAYQGGTTGYEFSQYAGGLSLSGKGGQELPGDFPTAYIQRSSTLNPNGFTPAELETIGKTLVGDWTGRPGGSASPNSDYALTYGNTFGPLGVVLSAVSNHGFHAIDETQRYFSVVAGGDLVAFNDYTLQTNRENVTGGLVGNVSLRLNDKNRFYLNTVFTRDASSEDRVQEGLQTASGGDIRDFRVRYQLEEVQSTRLRGEHNLSGPGLGSLVEWNIAHSTATNDSNLRENIYREAEPGVFRMQTGFADSGKLEYFNLDDTIQEGGGAYSLFFARPTGTTSGVLKFGAGRLKRTRDFGARRFRFVPKNLQHFDLTQSPDEIFVTSHISTTGFELRENTGVNDAYDAEHTVDDGYGMADVTTGRWRFIGGARYEHSEQRVSTFNPFDVEHVVDSIHNDNDILPSLNVVYQVQAHTNLRFAYARSLNRPEFRELSPFNFTEVAGGRSVSGNPDLRQATIDGYDARWETFRTGNEVVAASAFYKRISNPIEQIVQPTTEYRLSFVNAESASLYGIELELRRSLESLTPALRLWSVNANYSHIKSSVNVGEHRFSVVTNTDRPLEGQSDDVGNLALQFYHPQWGTLVRILGMYNSGRLTEVGAFGLPDAYEAASTTIDFVLSQSLGSFARGVELKLAASNLFNEKREFVQGGQIQRSYATGRKVSLSLSYTPF